MKNILEDIIVGLAMWIGVGGVIALVVLGAVGAGWLFEHWEYGVYVFNGLAIVFVLWLTGFAIRVWESPV